MVSVVAGLIIDTFGSLRETENNRLEDMSNKCFICGIDKYNKFFHSQARSSKNSYFKFNLFITTTYYKKIYISILD